MENKKLRRMEEFSYKKDILSKIQALDNSLKRSELEKEYTTKSEDDIREEYSSLLLLASKYSISSEISYLLDKKKSLEKTLDSRKEIIKSKGLLKLPNFSKNNALDKLENRILSLEEKIHSNVGTILVEKLAKGCKSKKDSIRYKIEELKKKGLYGNEEELSGYYSDIGKSYIADKLHKYYLQREVFPDKNIEEKVKSITYLFCYPQDQKESRIRNMFKHDDKKINALNSELFDLREEYDVKVKNFIKCYSLNNGKLTITENTFNKMKQELDDEFETKTMPLVKKRMLFMKKRAQVDEINQIVKIKGVRALNKDQFKVAYRMYRFC